MLESAGGYGFSNLCKIIREDFFNELTFEQRHESNEEVSHVNNQGRASQAESIVLTSKT